TCAGSDRSSRFPSALNELCTESSRTSAGTGDSDSGGSLIASAARFANVGTVLANSAKNSLTVFGAGEDSQRHAPARPPQSAFELIATGAEIRPARRPESRGERPTRPGSPSH